MEINFDQIFNVSFRAMKINRSHPYIPKDKKWVVCFIITHGIYTLGFLLFIYNIIDHDIKNRNITKACRDGALAIIYIVNTFYYAIILCYRDTLVSLIKAVRKDYKTKTASDDKIMHPHAAHGLKFCKIWMIITTAAAFLFPIKNIVISTYYCVTDSCRLVYVYELMLPDPIEENKNNIIVYIIVNALFLYYLAYAVTMYVSFVPLGPVFMLHICGQFDIVKHKIDNMFKDSTEEEIQEKCKSIVRHLQYIYSFMERMKKCFTEANEFLLKSAPLFLPISYYVLAESYHQGEANAEFISFVIGEVVICSSWCYYSDLVMDKGENTRLAAYSCGWESRYDRRARSTLTLVMMRAQRPVALCALFRIICLDALADIFRQSYTIFNLMNAVWN